ncbi:glycosyltransferase, partial [Escherichia coli]|uniref:glycosyltransferase n=1 Tax=Escherichia coli TaxID=562 RepID=UPI003CE56072
AKTMVAPELFQLSLSPNERKILFLSRFDRRKGCHELLDAFASIASSYPDWKLVLAGDGVERDSLKKKTADYGLTDRVEFPGYISG